MKKYTKEELKQIGDKTLESFKKIWKHKGFVRVYENDVHHDYLTKQKVRIVGVKNRKDNVVIDKNNVEYVIVKLKFLKANGVNEMQTDYNYSRLLQINNALSCKKKIIYIKEQQNELDDNLGFYEYLYQHESRKAYREALLEKISYMMYYNQLKEVVMYVLVENNNFKDTLNRYKRIYDCHVLDGDEVNMFLCKLHNRVE